MIKVTEDVTEIRGNMPQITDDIINIFKTLDKNCSKVEKLFLLYTLRCAIEIINIEKE